MKNNNKNNEPSISILAASKRSGVSHTAINKAIELGRLDKCVDRLGKKKKIWYSVFLKEGEEIGFAWKNKELETRSKSYNDEVNKIINDEEEFILYDKEKAKNIDEQKFIKIISLLTGYRSCLIDGVIYDELLKRVNDYLDSEPDIYYFFYSGIALLLHRVKAGKHDDVVKDMGIVNKYIDLEIKKYNFSFIEDIEKVTQIKLGIKF
ncbi:MAG: hypothetical protein LBQ74_14135 [Prevotella sp.]|jgi:hypothetical protein|nr:hypothetical protein [Prevotella sp.]